MLRMIEIFYKNKRDKNLKNLEIYKKGSWLLVQNPSDEEITELVDSFGLEEGHIRDALDPFETPRFEVEENGIYIFTRYSTKSNGKETTKTILFVLTDNTFFTITKDVCEPLNFFVEEKVEFYTTQKTKMLIQSLLRINKEFNSKIHDLRKNIQNLTSDIQSLENEDIVKLVEYERVLNEFLAILIPTSLVFEKIMHDRGVKLYEEDEELVEDLMLSNKQLVEIAKATLKHIVNVREAFTTIMSNKLNKTMKTLTAITIILTIPTMISSFYGMNVHLPLEGANNTFLIILLGSLAVSALLLRVFSKKDLL